jgi:hypothetical protein
MVDGHDVMENAGRLKHTLAMAKDIVDTIERFEQIRKRRASRMSKIKRASF